MVNESSKVSQPRSLGRRTSTATPAAFNITQLIWNFLQRPQDPRIHLQDPTYIPPFQRRRFFFPVDINFGWPSKSVTHPYQHNYWNILLLDFHYHSTHIKIPKFYSFLSIQPRTFFSQIHRHSYIHQHKCLNLCFLFVNIIIKIFTCLFVWFATLCVVLSFQPHAY